MKKIILTMCVAMLIVTLSGCKTQTVFNNDSMNSGSSIIEQQHEPNKGSGNNNPNTTVNDDDSWSTNKTGSTPDITKPSENKENSNSVVQGDVDNTSSNEPGGSIMDYPQLSPSELSSAIEKFPLERISLPDGSEVTKYDAVSADTDVLIFDFAFIRNASPIYKTTYDDPYLVKYVDGLWTTTFDVDELDEQIVAEYYKTKTGDMLGNGLMVSGAMCRIDTNGNIVRSDVYMSGDISVSGILNYLPEEDMYITEGTLYLRPDPTRATIPVLYSTFDMVYQFWDGYSNGEENPPFYMCFDGVAWDLGSIYDTKYNKFDLQYAFGNATTIAAKVTIGDLKYSSWEGMRGEIKEIQF